MESLQGNRLYARGHCYIYGAVYIWGQRALLYGAVIYGEGDHGIEYTYDCQVYEVVPSICKMSFGVTTLSLKGARIHPDI